jgi:hypothetical protein
VHRGGGEPGDCGFPYFAEKDPRPFKGLHGARLNADSVAVPIFSEDNLLRPEPETAQDEETNACLQAMPPKFAETISCEVGKEYPRIPGTIIIGETTKKVSVPTGTDFFPVFPKVIGEYYEDPDWGLRLLTSRVIRRGGARLKHAAHLHTVIDVSYAR